MNYRKCDKCNEGEGTHIYGMFKLCDACRDFVEREWKSPNTTPKIGITEKTRFGTNGEYKNGDAEIYLFNGAANKIEEILNHETMHHILNWLISVQASYCYDNIYRKTDIDRFMIVGAEQ